jgi:RsiW-degrading membrane proteinase PrsW (M82 family)
MSFLIASITPVIIFLYLTYRKDRIKEPAKILAWCFFGGFLSIILTLIIDAPLTPMVDSIANPLIKSFGDSFIVAAIPEEFSKFVVLYWIVWRNKDFDQHYDGILYAIFVSMGFALIENILYVFDGGMGVAMMRAVLSVPGHGFFAVLMGYYFSLAKFSEGRDRQRYLILSLAMPILFHGLYDFTLFYAGAKDTNPFVILLLMVFFTYLVIRLWRLGFQKIRLHLAEDEVKETV